uniref:ANK_REP_REGION domain-containing protein n=1 Tax=Trichobilharzia regenti TaxID=157069 RepID=A0AA85KD13_TRIRE|nr:unnamed protein product [Trichobilharzia regenti]
MMPSVKNVSEVIDSLSESSVCYILHNMAFSDLEETDLQSLLTTPIHFEVEQNQAETRLPKINTRNKFVGGKDSDYPVKFLSKESWYLHLVAFCAKCILPGTISERLMRSSRLIEAMLDWVSTPQNYVEFVDFCLNENSLNTLICRVKETVQFLSKELASFLCNIPSSYDSVSNRERISENILSLVIPEYISDIFIYYKNEERNLSIFQQSEKHTNKDSHLLLEYFEAFWNTDDNELKILLSIPLKQFHGEYNNDINRPKVVGTVFSDTKSKPVNLLKNIFSLRLIALVCICKAVLDLFKEGMKNTSVVLKNHHLYSDADNFISIHDMCAFVAVSLEKLNVLKYLINTGKIHPSRCVDPDGRNLIIAATSASKLNIIKYLITEVEPPININDKSHSGNTALHIAVCLNNLDLVKLLVDTGGASVDPVNINGNGTTPLHMAAMYGHTSIAEFLVQRSADLNSRTTLDGLTPFQLALTYQHNELANWLHQMNTAHRKVSPSSSISQHLSLKQTTLESLRKKFQ